MCVSKGCTLLYLMKAVRSVESGLLTCKNVSIAENMLCENCSDLTNGQRSVDQYESLGLSPM